MQSAKRHSKSEVMRRMKQWHTYTSGLCSGASNSMRAAQLRGAYARYQQRHPSPTQRWSGPGQSWSQV